MPAQRLGGAPGPSPQQRRAAERAAEHVRRKLREDIERLCADAGITLTELARAAGVPSAFLWRVMAGRARATIETYAKLGVPLGADLAARLYPNTGPVIRDRHQARILEAELQSLHPRWRVTSEATVWKPVRGTIDAVLHDVAARVLIANEIESDLRRIEQAIRWSKEKAEALPSWSGWPGVLAADGEAPNVSQLLIVRRTRGNRTIAADFARQLALAYPAHPADALAALRGSAAWQGSALVWAVVEQERVRFVDTR